MGSKRETQNCDVTVKMDGSACPMRQSNYMANEMGHSANGYAVLFLWTENVILFEVSSIED